MQDEIAEWVNINGGQATIIPSTAIRIDKEKIEQLLCSGNYLEKYARRRRNCRIDRKQ